MDSFHLNSTPHFCVKVPWASSEAEGSPTCNLYQIPLRVTLDSALLFKSSCLVGLVNMLAEPCRAPHLPAVAPTKATDNFRQSRASSPPCPGHAEPGTCSRCLKRSPLQRNLTTFTSISRSPSGPMALSLSMPAVKWSSSPDMVPWTSAHCSPVCVRREFDKTWKG